MELLFNAHHAQLIDLHFSFIFNKCKSTDEAVAFID